MDSTWDYGNAREHLRRVNEGMPPVIITCATTGGFQKTDNPNVPVTAAEQAEDAARVLEVGASIVHFHGRDPNDPTKDSHDPETYKAILAAVRARAPRALIDFTQTVAPLDAGGAELLGKIYYYKSAPMAARPDMMALNPGPMTFRGGGEYPSGIYITSFDDTLRAATAMRELGIKPQVFVYHPGHLDLLDHLIKHDALDSPYWVQLVFGQQSGISATPESVLYMARNLPPGCLFQTCALDLSAVQVNVLSLLLGGHVRCGLEDTIRYQRDEPAKSNVQSVERIARIARDLGRRVATVDETRQMLGLPERR